jgi:carotenoid cleavage dioxygenase
MPAVPWLLPFGTAACGGSSSPRNRYLEANFAPVETESTLTDLEVSGTLPRELSGRFLRNGPNPSTDTTAQDYHWFTGRGMVHGLRLREGRAEWYRNRFVGGNGANTNIIGHGTRTLAIVESGGVPQDLGYTLDTLGENTSIGTGYSAHPKLDPDTGALHAMCYDWAELQDHVRYVIVDAAGDWEDETDIPLPGMPMIHDMSLTANYAVIYDLPVTLSFLALAAGAAFPFRWDDEYEPRVGLLPRGGEAKDILWSPVSANYAYHPMNAYEDADGQVTIDIARYDRMFVNDTSGPFGDSLPRLDRWTINPHASAGLRKVSEQIVDERAQEFPRCHPGLNGRPYRYGYTVAVKDYGFPAIYKHDMTTGATAEYNLGAGRHSAEPVFVPKANAKAEDEGYLMTYVFDASNNKSEFVVLDAQDLARPALATVHLPARVPYGFHGNWVPDSAVGPT